LTLMKNHMKTATKFIKTLIYTGAVLGSTLAVVSPAFAQNWTQTAAPRWGWTSVASSADGTKLIAGSDWWVGYDESGRIYTSIDSGVTWISNNVPQAHWRSVASSTDGTKLVAVSDGDGDYNRGMIYTSRDSGVTWISNNVPPLYWGSVASSADGSKLVAAVGIPERYANGPIYVSTNGGMDWSLTAAPNRYWTSVASSADGTKLVAVSAAIGSSGRIYTSTDSGMTWISNNVPRSDWSSVASSADGTKLTAVAKLSHDGIWISTNSGVTWISNYVPPLDWVSVASSADGSKLVAAIQSSDIWISTNSGAAWVPSGAPWHQWSSVASSADGSKLVAAGYNNCGIYISHSMPVAPLITIQPQNQSQPAGFEAIFAVTAVGQEPLGCQWQCNGTNLTGATNSILSLANVQPNLAGVYNVIVSNALGTVVSSNAILVVGPAQPFTVLHYFDITNSGPRVLIQSGKFYGCSHFGSSVFSMNHDGSGFSVLHKLNSTDGWSLMDLVLEVNMLYGVAYQGGSLYYYGTVFSVGADGSDFKVLHNFGTNSADGIDPSTVIFSGNTVYGTTAATLFSMSPDGSHFSVLHTFGTEGVSIGKLLPLGNFLYGTVALGNNGGGAVFSMNTNGSNFNLIYNFTPDSTNGSSPSGNLIWSGDRFYGTTAGGGSYGLGVLFSLRTNGTGFTVLHSFTSEEESSRTIALAVAGDTVYGLMEKNGNPYANATMFSVSTNGAGFMLLHTFSRTDGYWDTADGASTSLLYSEGALYGIATDGGFWGTGTLFRLQLQSIRISGISAQPGGSVTVNCAGYPGCNYLTQIATNLTPPVSWQTVSTNVADTTYGTWQFTDTNTGSSPARFYRLATP
jgi:uncharacterized repeat protein (TIGR03803 family)